MLSGTLELHGLDVEPFVDRVVDVTLKKRNIVLSYHRHEDLVAYAVAELWIASRKYDASRYGDFRQFADGVARRKVIDWLRRDLGRTKWAFSSYVHQRARPDFLSFDGPGGSKLDGALAHEQGDFEAGGIDLRGILAS